MSSQLFALFDFDSPEISEYPVWVVEFEERIANGVILLFEKTHVELANTALHPDFQCCAIGRELLNFVAIRTRKNTIQNSVFHPCHVG